MATLKLKAGLLIVSDTAYNDPSTDKAGDILIDAIEKDGGGQWSVEGKQIVPDDVLAIQREVISWCDGSEYMNVIFTTGGTGFALKDRTPEALTPLLHKQAPGLV